MNLLCPHCLALNRVPPERLGDHPKCGKCGAAVLDGAPVELNGETFARFAAKDGLQMVCPCWWISGRRGAGRAR